MVVHCASEVKTMQGVTQPIKTSNLIIKVDEQLRITICFTVRYLFSALERNSEVRRYGACAR